MQQEFERLERSACTFKSIHDDYKYLYNLNYTLQPQTRCMHGGLEPHIDNIISFRGNTLQKCDTPKQPQGTYETMYANEKKMGNPANFHVTTSAKINTRRCDRLRDPSSS